MKHFSDLVAKVKGLSKASLLMLGVGVASLTLAVTSIGVGFGIQNSKAADLISSNNDASLSLFKKNGQNNVGLARKLLDLAAATMPSKIFNSSTGHPTAHGEKMASARDIAFANTGNRANATPFIKVFESMSPGQLTAITYPSAGGDPVFTFWLRGYTNTQYDSIPSVIATSYASDIPQYPLPACGAIAKPSELPYNWQANQGDFKRNDLFNNVTFSENSLPSVEFSASFWTPSLAEVLSNYWDLVGDELVGQIWRYLRTTTSVGVYKAIVNANGGGASQGISVSQSDMSGPGSLYCYSPAVHIKGSAIREVAAASVVFNSNGGTSVATRTVDYLQSTAAPIGVVKENHTLVGWYTDPACTSPYTFGTPVTTDLNLYAKWEENDKKSIHFDFGAPIIDYVNSTIARPEFPEREGYTFGGWFTDVDYAPEHEVKWPVTLYDDVNFYAKWTAISGTDNGGGTGTPENPIVPNYVDRSQKGLSPGALGGIIGGVLVAVGGAIILTIYIYTKKRNQAKA